MKRAANVLFVCVLVAVAFVAGGRLSQKGPAAATSARARRILYYACPMHPSLRATDPGTCMVCGMRLDPVYKDEPASAHVTLHRGKPAVPRPGSVCVSPDRQQIIGVKIAAVQQTTRVSVLRTVGHVAVDEARVYHLISGMQGRVVQVFPGATGDIVKKGQLLAVTSYLPDFLIAQQTFISALNTLDSYKEAEVRAAAEAKAAAARASAPANTTAPAGPRTSSGEFVRPPGAPAGMRMAGGQMRDPRPVMQSAFADYIRTGAQVRTTRETLMTMGMGEQQVEDLARNRKLVDYIEIRAPDDGVIVGRSIYREQKFDKGVEFYRLADLSHVWILADINGDDGKYLRPGKIVQVSVPNQARTLQARVSAALPQFDEASRVLRVRLEANNPRYVLTPGMFLDVETPVRASPSLVVPVDAVLDTGLSKTVFVERGRGFFEPRKVVTGWRAGERVEIKSGLRLGERIVVSGNFLLNSESRMKQTAADTNAEPRRRSFTRM
jgi:multidrug resistance efflux pump